MGDLWDSDNVGWATSSTEEQKAQDTTSRRRTTEVYELSDKYLYRRAFGEDKLLEAMGVDEFRQGHSYHIITGGNVDSLSFLKVILLHQNIKFMMMSTWCMAAEDVEQLKEWFKAGKIECLDTYVGEIFPSQYRIEWDMLKKFYQQNRVGRLAYFKNHSKIYAGVGDKFPFVIESSANVNTNPRTEQAVITIDRGLVDFYFSYFNKIKSFNYEHEV
jgi:hypothetical protein